MRILVRAIVSGFGFSMGAALFKKVSVHLGLEDPSSEIDKPNPDVADDGELNAGPLIN